MIWEPFALAIFFGLLVSAGLYFIFIWPRIEPPEPPEPDDSDEEE